MSDVSKLPKWAQEHIADLERTVVNLDEKLHKSWSVVAKDPQQGIVVDPYGDHPLALDPGFTVRLWVKPKEFAVDVSMRASMYGPPNPHLNVSGYGLRSTGLISVAPIAGNVIAVSEGER
jgi:hypothetical protein